MALARLQIQASLPSRDSFLAQCEALRHARKLERLRRWHREQLAALEHGQDVTAAAAQLESFARDFTSQARTDETGEADVFEVLEEWDAYNAGIRLPYVPTGITAVDDVCRGYVPNLNVIGGLPSVGKSAFVAESIMSCLEKGMRVGLFGLEDATKWITRRHMSRRMGLAVGDIGSRCLNEYQQERLADVAGDLCRLQERLYVYRQAGITPATLLATTKHWVLNRGVKLVFIYHGGEVQHEEGDKDRHDLSVANTYRLLRDFAVNHKVPIVVLCHFKRTDGDGKPKPSSFAETAYIERMARLALGLWEKPSAPDILRCTVLKQTEGRRGQTLALRRDAEHALLMRGEGWVVDEQAEAEAEGTRSRGEGWRRNERRPE